MLVRASIIIACVFAQGQVSGSAPQKQTATANQTSGQTSKTEEKNPALAEPQGCVSKTCSQL